MLPGEVAQEVTVPVFPAHLFIRKSRVSGKKRQLMLTARAGGACVKQARPQDVEIMMPVQPHIEPCWLNTPSPALCAASTS